MGTILILTHARARTDLCPVDYVAECISRVALCPPLHAAVHVCAPKAISLLTLTDWLREAGYELNEVSAGAFCARVRGVAEDHTLFAMKSLLSRPASSSSMRSAPTPPVCDGMRKVMECASKQTRKDPPHSITKEALALSIAFLLSKGDKASKTEAAR